MKDYKTDFDQILKQRKKGKTEAEKAPTALLIIIYFDTYNSVLRILSRVKI